MGPSNKKCREKEARKRRHRSRSDSASEEREREVVPKEKRHKHRKHHKERKREKLHKHYEYESHDSDVVEVSPDRVVTPPAPKIKSSESVGQSQDSLSIEDTNKLRLKLGLKPLEVKSGDKGRPDDKKKDDLGEFYHKPAQNLADKESREKYRHKLTEHKEKRQIESKLSKYKTLGESDSDDDVAHWVEKNRGVTKAKQEAKKREKMLEELDAQFGISETIESVQKEKSRQQYNEAHLKGLRVLHNVDNIAEERDVVLTLKDQNVLDSNEDVLINVNLVDEERYRKNVENLKKKIRYNAYEGEEFDELGLPKERSLLSQYDEEIGGVKTDSFQIGHEDISERKRAALQSIKDKLKNKRLETLATPGLVLASEYYSEQEMAKFKKPKKKVRKMRMKGKMMTADDLEKVKNTGIEEVGTRRVKKEDHLDIDDVPYINIDVNALKVEEKEETLEKALNKAKKLKRKENGPSIISTLMEMKPEPLDEKKEIGTIVLNETAEFCRSLGDIPTYGKAGNREEVVDEMDFDGDGNKSSDDDDVQIISDDEGGRWNSVDPNEQRQVNIPPTEVPILDEEPDVGSGVGAALKLAMSKGYLDKEQNNRPSNTRLAHLQAKHYSIEDKNYADEGERNGRRERYTGPVQEFKEKDTFKPNVKLEYIDDEGHVLNSKEAFRYLSHKFHGKGPGKNKIEKRIKKSQQEGLMKKMSSTDTPLGTLNMLQAKQKEMQSPYIVLSGGKHTHSTTISKQHR